MILNPEELERFMDKVAVQPNGCWLWTASQFRGGYGRFTLNGKSLCAHVVIWEHHNGPKPQATLDHFACDTPSCVNPDHVRPASQRENLLRGNTQAADRRSRTHCPKGHELSPSNTYTDPQGCRHCRRCRNDLTMAWKRRKSAEAKRAAKDLLVLHRELTEPKEFP